MSVSIEVAETAEQFDLGGRLIRAYAEFLGLDLEFQGFSSELASLPIVRSTQRCAIAELY